MPALSQLFDDYDELAAPLLRESNGQLSLHFNIGGVQSLMDMHDPLRLMLGYTRTMMEFLKFCPAPAHIGMVGLGGGSLTKYCHATLPETRISVAEICPEVIALRNDFKIPADDARLQITCADGADFVRRNNDVFDVLIIDGFDAAGQPPDLCSEAFYDDCRRALTPDGILVVNICDSRRSMLIPRLRKSFQRRVLVVDGEDSTNTIAFAGPTVML